MVRYWIQDKENKKMFEMLAEPCESTLFSQYINVEGKAFPCSFTEGERGYEGIDVVNCNDFMTDVWYSPAAKEFREKLLNNKDCRGCRKCPQFDLY